MEATQEILIGFTVTAVLGDDQSGYNLERLRRPRENALVDLLARTLKALAASLGFGSDLHDRKFN